MYMNREKEIHMYMSRSIYRTGDLETTAPSTSIRSTAASAAGESKGGTAMGLAYEGGPPGVDSASDQAGPPGVSPAHELVGVLVSRAMPGVGWQGEKTAEETEARKAGVAPAPT